MPKLSKIQVPAAVLLIALAVVNYWADLGIPSEAMLALVFGAGVLAPQPVRD